MASIKRAKTRELPLTKDSFSRFKDRLGGERFHLQEEELARQILQAGRDFSGYRINVSVGLSLSDPGRFPIYPYKAEARIVYFPGSELPWKMIARAFPAARHGNIALRYHEMELSETLPEAGPYRSTNVRTLMSEDVDMAHLLKAGNDLSQAREESAGLIRKMMSARSSRRLSDNDIMLRIVERIMENQTISSAVEEHVPDCF